MPEYQAGTPTPVLVVGEKSIMQTYKDGYGLRLYNNARGRLSISLVFADESVEYYIELSDEFIKKAHEALGKHIT